MTGRHSFNYPAFATAERQLRALGYDVVSPHHNGDGDMAKPWQWYVRKGLAQLLTCDAIALLPDWEDSRGATLEHRIATELRMECKPLSEWLANVEVSA
jgi:hypothetical protein